MENPTEDVSLYDDLQGDLGSLIHKLQTKNNQLELHVVSLEEDIQKLCNRITEMKHTQDNLSRNISELYKTAKAEIDRKDRIIAELQSKLDDVVFRRNTVQSNKRLCEVNLEPEIKKPRFDNKSGNREHENTIVRNQNTQDTRHRNNAKNERDSREHPRFDNDRRRSNSRGRRSNSRDTNFRRDYRDNRGRNLSNNRDRNFRNRNSRGGKDYNARSRNEHHERDRPSRSDEREQSDVNDQRVSNIDSTEVFPKPTEEINILDLSREDGEITDVEAEAKTQKIVEKIPELKKFTELPRNEVKKTFSVSEYIERQKAMASKKNTDKKIRESNEKKEIKHVKEDIKAKNDKIKKVADKDVEEIKSERLGDSDVKIGGSETDPSIKGEEKTIEKEIEEKIESAPLKTDKIKILSQVKLDVEKVEKNVKPIPERQKSEPKIQVIPKIERSVKESRVPRNLIEDLDIKLQKPTSKVNKTKDTKKAEKLQEKITSLFDTPIKKEIKPLELPSTSKTDVDVESNQSVVDIKETSTPVTEFQIFKTNLPCLDNSLTNIQFQTKTDVAKTKQDFVVKITNEPSNNTSKFVENESAGYGNTSDICNISLDLLNAEICKYKPEDFPNLTAHSEIKDISDILLSPDAIPDKQKAPPLPAQIPKDDTDKEISSNDLNSTNSSVVSTDGNSRKKRRRCVMKWIE